MCFLSLFSRKTPRFFVPPESAARRGSVRGYSRASLVLSRRPARYRGKGDGPYRPDHTRNSIHFTTEGGVTPNARPPTRVSKSQSVESYNATSRPIRVSSNVGPRGVDRVCVTRLFGGSNGTHTIHESREPNTHTKHQSLDRSRRVVKCTRQWRPRVLNSWKSNSLAFEQSRAKLGRMRLASFRAVSAVLGVPNLKVSSGFRAVSTAGAIFFVHKSTQHIERFVI